MTRFRVPLIALGAAVALLAAGCGGTSGASAGGATPTVSSLMSQMATATKQAQNVHLSGAVNNSGQNVRMNLDLAKAGGLAGTLGVAPSPDVYVLSTQGNVYIKVTAAYLQYLKAPAGACSSMCDKYLLATGSMKDLTGSVGWTQIIAPIAKNASPDGVNITGKKTVNGQQAWELKAGDGTVVDIAAQGTPYLLRISTPGSSGGMLNFTDWNNVTIPAPPPASQVVDISKLTG